MAFPESLNHIVGMIKSPLNVEKETLSQPMDRGGSVPK